MSQRARPVEDVSAGNWTPTPVYAQLNEEVPDLNSVASADDPDGDSFTVKLRPLARPNERCPRRPPRLTVRLKKAGPCPAHALIELLQGAAVIASGLAQPGEEYQDEVIDLTGQLAGITNFKDLHLRVTAWSSCSSSSSSSSGGVSVPCCQGVQLPAVLTATFSGSLAPLGSVQLTWQGGFWASGVLFTPCRAMEFAFSCDEATGQFRLEELLRQTLTGEAPADSCDPFSWSFSGTASGFCAGSYSVTVTP